MYSAMMRTVQIAVLAALAGCASAKQPETPCATLNREIGAQAKDISAVAIRRGTVDHLDVPLWVPGGTKAVSVIKSKQTEKIETLRAEQSISIDNRDRNCQ